jgi:hypothetical protein
VVPPGAFVEQAGCSLAGRLATAAGDPLRRNSGRGLESAETFVAAVAAAVVVVAVVATGISAAVVAAVVVVVVVVAAAAAVAAVVAAAVAVFGTR